MWDSLRSPLEVGARSVSAKGGFSSLWDQALESGPSLSFPTASAREGSGWRVDVWVGDEGVMS